MNSPRTPGPSQHNDLDTLDYLIDKSLASLRAARPSPTLETRTLAALERTIQQPRSRWQVLWPALTAAGLAACVAAIVLSQHPAAATHPSPLAATTPPVSSLLPPTSHLSPATKPLTAQRSLLDAHTQPLPASVAATLQQQPQDAEAALALAETLAPSRPVAAAPLTADERALVRASRSGELAQLADLSPSREASLRSALEARRERAVDNYVHRMLAPLAAAEALNPTSTADEPQPPAQPAEEQPDPNGSAPTGH